MLPCFLRREISESIGSKYLSELDLFQGLPSEIVGLIALSMQSISCNRGKSLFRRGDIAKHLYIQRTGVAFLEYLDGTHRVLRRGDVVGERALISGRRRYSVTTSGWTEFFALNVDDIRLVFQRMFKPRRFLFEWRRLKKLVQSTTRRDDTKKNERRCDLGKELGSGSTPSYDGVTRSIYSWIERVAVRPKQSPSAASASNKTPRRTPLESESERELSTSTATPNPLSSADVLSSNKTPIPNDNSSDPQRDRDVVNRVSRDERAQSMPDTLPPRELRRQPLRVKVRAHGASKSVANALPSTFVEADDAGSWISKMSPFETRQNSLRRDQRVLAHTMKTLSVFAPFPKEALSRNDSFSDTDSLDRDDLSATEKELSRRTKHSRDSLLLSALDSTSALCLDREQQRRPALNRRLSRNMGKFRTPRKRSVASPIIAQCSKTPSAFGVDTMHWMGYGGCTPSDGMSPIPTPAADSCSEPREPPNLTECRRGSRDLQQLFSKEAEDVAAHRATRCFVPTAMELSDIMELTTIPKTTSWSTRTGSGDEAAKEMPSGDDFGALEYDGADGELIRSPEVGHSAHSGDAEKESEH